MKKIFKWIKHRLSHKIDHIRWSSIKKTLKDHGLALVVIILVWEIIEDILFPILFLLLGNYVHPVFLAGIPVAWLICLHWLAVPFMWGLWIKIKNDNK